MGLDAFADCSEEDEEVFKQACREQVKEHGSADLFLENGGLDCKSSINALRAATGEFIVFGTVWSAEKVNTLVNNANWSRYKKSPDMSDGARRFLESCAAIGCGVRFE